MKNSRQKRILEIINSQHVETQEELTRKLGESGYSVTQATVSRDINALRLVKTPDGSGGYRYSESGLKNPANTSKFFAMFSENVASVNRGQNIVCLKCLTGMAQAVCASFDSMGKDNIVGTLPSPEDLIETARPLVRLQGLHGELKPQLSAFSWNRK